MTYTVLIVDDSKLARMAMVKAIRGCDATAICVEAGSAADAIKALQQNPPDVALVDFNMPLQDGLDLAADLRKVSPTLPIAIVSANHQKQVMDRTNALGATFLPKPVAEEGLRSFLNKAARDLQRAKS